MNLSILKRKQMMALVTVAGLVLLATAALASNPFVLDWRVLGFGPATGTCQVSFTSGCTSVSIGSAQGTHIGSGTYTLSVTTGSDNGGATDPNNHATNASGGKCLPANGDNNTLGPNNISAADGSTINFNTVGWLCEEGSQGSPYHYNGTYRVASGTGRFSTVTGGGSLTATFEKGGLTNNTYLKVDGTINF